MISRWLHKRPPARRKKALDHLLNTIRNFDFHDDHHYHPQTLGPLPIISLVCPELESSKICLRTHLFLPLGQKEIRKTGLPLSLIPSNSFLVQLNQIGHFFKDKMLYMLKKSPPPPSDALPGASVGGVCKFENNFINS